METKSTAVGGSLVLVQSSQVLFFAKWEELLHRKYQLSPEPRTTMSRCMPTPIPWATKVDWSWVQYQRVQRGLPIVDGNEKVHRTMCAAPKQSVYIEGGKFSLMSCCLNTPALGGKHQTASKYCKFHKDLDTKGDPASIKINLKDDIQNEAIVRAAETHMQEGLPDIGMLEDGVNETCKKESKKRSFYNRTAGILALVRPCGIIANWTEMYTTESLSQVFFFLINTFGRSNDISKVRFLGYDRGCSLHPFLVNLRKKNAPFSKYILDNVRVLVDRFHVKNHISTACMPPENPECKYHPDLPQFSEVRDCNTQCAEQAFSWINKMKNNVRRMGRFKFNFFLYTMIEIYNINRVSDLTWM